MKSHTRLEGKGNNIGRRVKQINNPKYFPVIFIGSIYGEFKSIAYMKCFNDYFGNIIQFETT